MDAVLAQSRSRMAPTVCTTDRVLRAQVDEPSRSERLTEFGPPPVRIGRAMQTMIERYRRQTTGITGTGEPVTLSHEIAAVPPMIS